MSQKALLIIEALIKHGPALARELYALFQLQRDPTLEELEKLYGIVNKSYDQHIAEARARAGGQS